MISSMTAFARAEYREELGELTWELRSVNHRYLEPYLRLPEELRAIEPAVRERLAKRLSRGKLDCALRFKPPTGGAGGLTLNERLAHQLIEAGHQLAVLMGGATGLKPADLLRWPGVLEQPEQDLGAVQQQALGLFDRALDGLLENRRREGERLAAIVDQRRQALAELVTEVRARRPQVLEGVRQRIRARLEEVVSELDNQRLEQEMALIAQRLDVDEEMDRLATHLDEVGRVLARDEPVGRRLDFLMQELNREANTLGSKSNDAETTRLSVEMKVLIEQMREQIQNIE